MSAQRSAHMNAFAFAQPAKKPGAARTAQQVTRWSEESLPPAYAGEVVSVNEVPCAKPECPVETVIMVMLPRPKMLRVPKPLVEVTQTEVVAQMQANAEKICSDGLCARDPWFLPTRAGMG